MASKTQSQILDYLDRHPSASAEEISRDLTMTKENIQYHLKIMLGIGTVSRTSLPESKETLRGRPTFLYRLSDQSRQGDIPALADKLLEVVLNNSTPLSFQQNFLTRLASAMFPYQPSANPTRQLRQTMQRLNQHQYRASWEARSSGPYIYFRNCPYASIIQRHPELCQLDCTILNAMLNGSVSQIAKMDLESRNPPACIFIIQPDPISK